MSLPSLSLAPWTGAVALGRATTLRVTEFGGQFGVGVAIPGQSDLRGGLVTAAQLLAFAKELQALALARLSAEFEAARPVIEARDAEGRR